MRFVLLLYAAGYPNCISTIERIAADFQRKSVDERKRMGNKYLIEDELVVVPMRLACSSALQSSVYNWLCQRKFERGKMGKPGGFPNKTGAGNETRTRDLYLGKVSLYQLSYSRVIEKMFGGATQSRTGLIGFAIRCITALLSRRCTAKLKNYGKAERLSQLIWSGKRDSNSRPIPWQGIALPTELFPQKTKSALYG